MDGDRPRHRFFVDTVGDEVTIEGLLARQISRVLRMRPGERITLVGRDGRERDIVLDTVSPVHVRGRVDFDCTNLAEPRLGVTLFQALVGRDKLDQVIQKATEVGVARIVLVRCERSLADRAWSPTSDARERWTRIATEAAEQSRRGRVPTIEGPVSLLDAVMDAVDREPRPARLIAAHPGPDSAPLAACLGTPNESLGIFVGPEGGFTPAERAALTTRGVLMATAGPRVMRTETAGPVLVALALFAAGDMG